MSILNLALLSVILAVPIWYTPAWALSTMGLCMYYMTCRYLDALGNLFESGLSKLQNSPALHFLIKRKTLATSVVDGIWGS